MPTQEKVDSVATLKERLGAAKTAVLTEYRGLTVLPTLALGLLAAATWRTHHPGESIESPSDP